MVLLAAPALFVWTGCASTSASDLGGPEPGSTTGTAPVAAAAPGGGGGAAALTAYFSAAQADHGQRVFGNVCGVCHGAAEFRGPIFRLSWMDRPVGDLFQHVSTLMPQDAPGSLRPEEYAAVVAHILRLNGLTPGDRELPADPEQLRSLTWGR